MGHLAIFLVDPRIHWRTNQRPLIVQFLRLGKPSIELWIRIGIQSSFQNRELLVSRVANGLTRLIDRFARSSRWLPVSALSTLFLLMSCLTLFLLVPCTRVFEQAD
jgi:hypothetical protein